MKRQADGRRTLATLLASSPGRPLREIMRHAAFILDCGLQDAVAEIQETEHPTPAQVERLTLAAGRAATMAKQALDAGVSDDVGTTAVQVDADVVTAVDRVMTALGQVWPGDSHELRRWATSALSAALQGLDLPSPPRYVTSASGWRLPVAALESAETVKARNGNGDLPEPDRIVSVDEWLERHGWDAQRAAEHAEDGPGPVGQTEADNGVASRTERQSNGSRARNHTDVVSGRNPWKFDKPAWSRPIDRKQQ